MLDEFEIIKRYFTHHYQREDLIAGIGDDCAIVSPPSNEVLVFTMDTLVSGVHFPHDASSFDIAYRTVAVNLSDLAAIGAKPLWVTLALTLPVAEEVWLEKFSQGLFTLLDYYRVALIGGDLTYGPLCLTIQAHGSVPKNKALCRNRAKAGDLIYITGTLGDAGLALQCLNKSITLYGKDEAFILERFYRPTPRVELGMMAREFAHSAIDISDGLAQDLQHILKQSQVGAEIYQEKLPLSTTLEHAIGKEAAYRLALTHGDDYELCLTIPPCHQVAFEKAAIAICPITCIGKITVAPGLRIFSNGREIHFSISGYQHF